MTDHIRVSRIAVYAYHGALDEERRIGQRFYVTLDCSLDLAGAGRRDDLGQTISYVDLTDVAVRTATARRFQTIEGLAETIASDILAEFAKLQAITVTVEKPSAPVPAIIDGVSVQVTRSRSD